MADPLFRSLFDDASLFPPAGLGMLDAVAGHLRHGTAWYREMCGPFVVAAARLPQLGAVLTAAGVAELDLALVLPGGAADLDAALDAVFADPRLRLRAVELPVDPGGADVAGAVGAVAAALDRAPLAGATAFIEVPAAYVTTAAARAAAEHGYLMKLRTGGTEAATFPSEVTLADAIRTLAGERVGFKCTAGLHHAVRHQAADTGFEHHGFLNVLLAVAAARAGADGGDVAVRLAETNASAVAAQVSQLDEDAAAGARELFTSFGTCSTDEPVADLVTLGLVTAG